MYLYASLYSIYIFTIGYFFSKNRKLISNICEVLDYQKVKEILRPELKTIIPEIEIADLAPDDIPVYLRELGWTDGNVSLLELAVIAKLIRKNAPKAIFEIGTFDGRTTLNLACNSPEDARVYTLDLPKGSGRPENVASPASDMSFVNKAATGSRFRGTEYEKKITQLYGDSATFDFSPYHNAIDLVFVDGAHTYEYILSDSQKALKLLKGRRGIILWHDYSWVWEGVTRALNRLYTTEDACKGLRHIKGTSLVCLINT
jgi:hypothetical protein